MSEIYVIRHHTGSGQDRSEEMIAAHQDHRRCCEFIATLKEALGDDERYTVEPVRILADLKKTPEATGQDCQPAAMAPSIIS